MGLQKKVKLDGNVVFDDAEINEITPDTGQDLTINLLDNAGARKVIVKDSDGATVLTIDSNGVITGVQAVVNTINAAASTDLAINGVTGKDIKVKLTDASGSRKLIVLDSADAEVCTIDSNGNIVAAGITSTLVGDVTGNLTGSVTNIADVAIDFAAGHADVTLSAAQKKGAILVVTNADQAANIIGPAENRAYWVRNASGQAITVKKAGGTGIAIANGKTALVAYSNTAADYIRLTADATH